MGSPLWSHQQRTTLWQFARSENMLEMKKSNNDRKYQYVQRTNHHIKSFYHSLGNYEISISLRNLVRKCDRVSGGETLTRSDDVVECRIEDEISFLDGSQHH